MDQIAEVITGLDGDVTGKPVVTVFVPSNTDPDELKTMMNDLFNPTTAGTANRPTTQQQGSALGQRVNAQQQQQVNPNSRSTMGQGTRSGGGGAAPSF